jgi:hypothetical protein
LLIDGGDLGPKLGLGIRDAWNKGTEVLRIMRMMRMMRKVLPRPSVRSVAVSGEAFERRNASHPVDSGIEVRRDPGFASCISGYCLLRRESV